MSELLSTIRRVLYTLAATSIVVLLVGTSPIATTPYDRAYRDLVLFSGIQWHSMADRGFIVHLDSVDGAPQRFRFPPHASDTEPRIVKMVRAFDSTAQRLPTANGYVRANIRFEFDSTTSWPDDTPLLIESVSLLTTPLDSLLAYLDRDPPYRVVRPEVTTDTIERLVRAFRCSDEQHCILFALQADYRAERYILSGRVRYASDPPTTTRGYFTVPFEVKEDTLSMTVRDWVDINDHASRLFTSDVRTVHDEMRVISLPSVRQHPDLRSFTVPVAMRMLRERQAAVAGTTTIAGVQIGKSSIALAGPIALTVLLIYSLVHLSRLADSFAGGTPDIGPFPLAVLYPGTSAAWLSIVIVVLLPVTATLSVSVRSAYSLGLDSLAPPRFEVLFRVALPTLLLGIVSYFATRVQSVIIDLRRWLLPLPAVSTSRSLRARRQWRARRWSTELLRDCGSAALLWSIPAAFFESQAFLDVAPLGIISGWLGQLLTLVLVTTGLLGRHYFRIRRVMRIARRLRSAPGRHRSPQ